VTRIAGTIDFCGQCDFTVLKPTALTSLIFCLALRGPGKADPRYFQKQFTSDESARRLGKLIDEIGGDAHAAGCCLLHDIDHVT